MGILRCQCIAGFPVGGWASACLGCLVVLALGCTPKPASYRTVKFKPTTHTKSTSPKKTSTPRSRALW
ncbi:MAG: hypothetical protein H7Z75_09125 [Ferruginibacter sp.]|nr:hypothetical protein [Cytophagales bacterium]